jgi:chorismate mutase-like protein
MMDKLPRFRRELDELDEQILVVLSRRMNICREVALYKSEADIPMMQGDRIAQVKARAVAKGKANGLSESFVLSLYEIVITEACRIENEIIASSKRDSD